MAALRVALLGIVVSALPAFAWAQTLDPARVKTGQNVVVHDDTGEAHRGRVLSVSPSSLTIQPRSGGGTETFSLESIARINHRDSTAEGFFIGLGAGFAAAWGVRQSMCPNDDECGAIVSLYLGLPITAGSAALGALIDHLHQPALFGAGEGRRRISIAPIVGRRTGGAMLSMRF